MDGNLPGLLALTAEAGALLVIDDAHATGVWNAYGSLEHFGPRLTPEVAMVGTFGKALGGLGGFVAGSAPVIDCLINQARAFLCTTAPPLPAVAAADLRLVDEKTWWRDKLHQLGPHLRARLGDLGLRVLFQDGAIIPLLMGGAEKSLAIGQALPTAGALTQAFQPPTVPPGTSRVRLTVTAAYEMADMDQDTLAIAAAAQEVGI
ncbi:hypothetical protein DFAR_1680002 [Desulfarculales bacterium]